MHFLASGSIFAKVVAIVEGFSIGSSYLAWARNSKQKKFDFQWEKMN